MLNIITKKEINMWEILHISSVQDFKIELSKLFNVLGKRSIVIVTNNKIKELMKLNN